MNITVLRLSQVDMLILCLLSI